MFIFITLVLTNLSSNKAEQKKFLLDEERQQCLNHDRWLSTKNSLRCCFFARISGVAILFRCVQNKKKERRWKENKQIITSSYADYLVSFCTQLFLVVFACMLHPIACKHFTTLQGFWMELKLRNKWLIIDALQWTCPCPWTM